MPALPRKIKVTTRLLTGVPCSALQFLVSNVLHITAESAQSFPKAGKSENWGWLGPNSARLRSEQ